MPPANRVMSTSAKRVVSKPVEETLAAVADLADDEHLQVRHAVG
jgi:hypothetical protein